MSSFQMRVYKHMKKQAYTPENLREALLYLQHGATFRDASTTFGIPLMTLNDNFCGRIHANVGRKTALTNDEEEYIVAAMVYCAENGWPMNREDLKVMVRNYILLDPKRHHPWVKKGPGIEFIRSFEKRWRHRITKRTPEVITTARSKSLSKAALDAFMAMMRTVYDEHDLEGRPGNCYNLDETGCTTDEKAQSCFFKTGSKFTPVLNASA